jgi:hypothetical protein
MCHFGLLDLCTGDSNELGLLIYALSVYELISIWHLALQDELKHGLLRDVIHRSSCRLKSLHALSSTEEQRG